MHLARLQNRPTLVATPGFRGTNTITESVNFRSHESVCEHYQPYVTVDMAKVKVVNEATYKDLATLIDPNFLQQGVRAEALTGIRHVGFEPEDTMNFHINSSEHTKNRIRYTNSFQFDQWEEIGADPDFNYNEKARLLLWVGDVRMHCTCPSFLYAARRADILDPAPLPSAASVRAVCHSHR